MDCVSIICNKYNIDKTDAVRVLTNEGIKLKTTIKHFPWNGVPNKDCCEGLKYCGGLFIQCKNKKTEGSDNYCSFCFKQSEQNEHNKPNCGNIQDRMKVSALDYVDPKGRKVVPFSTYMRKKKIDRELAEIEATMNNITIDENQFTEVVVKRGRPKKTDENTGAKKTNPISEKKCGNQKKENSVNSNDDKQEEIVNKDKDEENLHDKRGEDDENDYKDEDESMASNGEKNEINGHVFNLGDDVSEIEVDEIEYKGTIYYLADNGQVYNDEENIIGNWNYETNEIDFCENEK